MLDELVDSSDSVRSSKPLRHLQLFSIPGTMKLELGGELEDVKVAYETYGRLNRDGSNAVLICHAISGDSHIARHDDNDDAGWWDIAVGPGKAIDTNKYFVICPNVLGGCRGSTGPDSINPRTRKRYGKDFPTITIADMVAAQRKLVEHLGIEKLLAVVGGSMGGHQALCWASKYAQNIKAIIALATSPRLTSQALAFDVVGRNAILRDPNFHGGRYCDKSCSPAVGLAIARMIGHITYLSPEAMQEKFDLDRLRPRDVQTEFEKRFSVGSYLGYQGEKFVERFDANSYITLTTAMDLFDLGATRQDLTRSLGDSDCRWLIVSFSSDWLFPPSQSQEIVDALIAGNIPVSYCNVQSKCGHDAFLLENDLESFGGLIREFLSNLCGHSSNCSCKDNRPQRNPRSIFHHRLDYDRIVDLLDPHTKVLDLGCGDGQLLARLVDRGHRAVGVELNEREIISCISKGLDVIQADLDHGLASFGDKQFDYVILSQTLQTVRDVERVISEMLRVGTSCIVSFPNFAYRKLRTMLFEQGKAPESLTGLLRYKWYNTPNIRFLSIADFESFCAEKSVVVHRRIALNSETREQVDDDPNLNADMAIFVLSGANQ